MAANMTYTPSCHTASAQRFIVDLSRAPGKAQYAMLLAANMAGRNVTVALNETCIGGVALIRNVNIAD
jgi:hypothetical protein